MDPSKLPTSLEDPGLIDSIQNYVIYDYKTQFEALSTEEKKPLFFQTLSITKYVLKTAHNKFVRAKLDQATNVGPSEKFHLIQKGANGYAFRTA